MIVRMLRAEEYFNNLVTTLACIGLIINTFCVCFICSRRNLLHQPVIVFVAVLVVKDILSSLNFIISAQWPSLWVYNLISCKTYYFITLIVDNFEPMLLVVSLIVFTVTPEINVKKSMVIILTIFCATLILTIRRTLDAEVKDLSGSKKCFSFLSLNESTQLFSLLLTLVLPVIMLIVFIFEEMFEQKQNRELTKTPKEFKMLQMMLITYVILVGPYLIFHQYYYEIYEYFGSDSFYPHIITKIIDTIFKLNILSKPMLLYIMSEDVKSEINSLFRSTLRHRPVELEIQVKDSVEEVKICH